MARIRQQSLFEEVGSTAIADAVSSTFVNNMKLPVHRWFRYSAGFSAAWAEQVIRRSAVNRSIRVFDPFAGSGTTLLAAENENVESWGIDSHPFINRVAKAKLAWRSDVRAYTAKMRELCQVARRLTPDTAGYPPLIYKCYSETTLERLDVLRQAYDAIADDSPAAQLAWLTIVAILRRTSHAGTAQWQYVLPRKQKRSPQAADAALDECVRMFQRDMMVGAELSGPNAKHASGDARECAGIPDGYADLVITSPPYPNNYDYADATRLEMSFFREIRGWGDLHEKVRRNLVCSCSQHVPERSIDLPSVLNSVELAPIREEIVAICDQLAQIRKTKGGKKTYHLMIACYFRDLALVWKALRRVCAADSTVCFVVGDSAPYGVYVPVIPWLGSLAIVAGFKSFRFEKTRERNVKWKNRKHRVPLQEGRLWVEG